MRASHLVAILALGVLSACSLADRERTLHDLRTNSGEPEEFGILPNKPLEAPESFAELPTPTPGGANRTDQTPKADAVAALGGNPARLAAGDGVGVGDQALVARASRFGRDPQVRAQLAAEDEEFRKRKSLFTFSVLPTDEYYNAYRRQALDPYLWLQRYRAAGARTPTAPPGN